MEIPRGRGWGVIKVTFLEAIYENKLEFPGGEGVRRDIFRGRGGGGAKGIFLGGRGGEGIFLVWIFSGTAHYDSNLVTD